MIDKKALDTLEEEAKKKYETQQAVNEGDTKRKEVEKVATRRPWVYSRKRPRVKVEHNKR